MIGHDKSEGHCEEQACSDQTRRRWRWNIKEPASSAHDKAENESDYGGSHSSTLLRTRSNRTRNPTGSADAKCENVIGWRALPNRDWLRPSMVLGNNRRIA